MTSRLAKLLMIGGAAISLGLAADFATAQAAEIGVGVNLELAPNEPPPLRVEPVPPPPYENAFWIRGHWHWVGNNWAWIPGHYVTRPRREARWDEGHWDRRPDGQWVWIEGHWH